MHEYLITNKQYKISGMEEEVDRVILRISDCYDTIMLDILEITKQRLQD